LCFQIREQSVDKKKKKEEIGALYSLLPRTGTKIDNAGEVLRQQGVDSNYYDCYTRAKIP